MLCGSSDILKAACDHLGIKPSETTKDGMFTVIEVECQGACSNAPMMVVNDDFYVSHFSPNKFTDKVILPPFCFLKKGGLDACDDCTHFGRI
jgi:NADH:ubiquinone oxidoreductase subunit E